MIEKKNLTALLLTTTFSVVTAAAMDTELGERTDSPSVAMLVTAADNHNVDLDSVVHSGTEDFGFGNFDFSNVSAVQSATNTALLSQDDEEDGEGQGDGTGSVHSSDVVEEDGEGQGDGTGSVHSSDVVEEDDEDSEDEATHVSYEVVESDVEESEDIVYTNKKNPGEIKRKNGTLVAYNNPEVIAMANQAEILTNKLFDASEKIGKKDAQLAELATTLGQKDEQLAELATTLGQKDEQLAELTTTIGQKDEQLAELTTTIGQKDVQLAEVSQFFESAKLTIAEREEQLTALTEELAQARALVTNANLQQAISLLSAYDADPTKYQSNGAIANIVTQVKAMFSINLQRANAALKPLMDAVDAAEAAKKHIKAAPSRTLAEYQAYAKSKLKGNQRSQVLSMSSATACAEFFEQNGITF